MDSIELKGRKVLVVDDNATNRRILHVAMNNWGMKVTVAAAGAEAFAAMQNAQDNGAPYELVLLDCQMPEMDGFTVAEKIRQGLDRRELIILMLTSVTQQGAFERCQALGISAHLQKPIRLSDLMQSIKRSLGKDRPVAAGAPKQAVALLGALRVLLAEDNIVNERLAVRLLEKSGHSVHVATNGRLALEALDHEAFDVVLMDVQMPEMGGFEATSIIRRQEKTTHRHIPIVAMTAHAMKGDHEKCLAAGMDYYISKPISSKELQSLLSSIAEHAPLQATTQR